MIFRQSVSDTAASFAGRRWSAAVSQTNRSTLLTRKAMKQSERCGWALPQPRSVDISRLLLSLAVSGCASFAFTREQLFALSDRQVKFAT
jgi:hypothetical protein